MSQAVFKRKIYDKMLQWKNETNGRTALLIEGARRIGKSTVVEELGKNEYKSYLLIDFSAAPKDVLNLFDDVSNLSELFLMLQLHYHVDLEERESLIIFDEVQFCPKARQAIKHLVKDGRYDYIETGSLISIKKNVESILIPSEERKMSMYPMDYEEFLWAIGDNSTYSLLRKFYESKHPLGDDMNRRMMKLFRMYMLVGGMPQAVAEFIETNNFRNVDLVKRDILSLYDDDFRKIDSSGRISMLFDSIPAELSRNTSRYKVSSVLDGSRAANILGLISEMEASKTVLLSYHADDPGVGLASIRNLSLFKLFTSDTGLFVTLMFKDRAFTENEIYEKLLSDKLPANLGYLYENVVAQMLASYGCRLFYYTWANAESTHSREVDFLIARKNKICPIEVKSSGHRSHVSFDEFCDKFSDRVIDKTIIHTKDYARKGDLTLLPVYMAPFLAE